jgi:hypothetical protein
MKSPNYLAEPQIQYLSQLLDEIHNGTLFVPKFQRDLVWTDEQRLDFLHSISEGIPIGSLFVWHTSQSDLAILDNIGGLPVPPLPETPDTPRAYLLDGYKRLSTLFGAIKRPSEKMSKKTDVVNGIDWRFFYDLEKEEFVLQGRRKIKPTWLPVNVLLDSLALLRFQYQLETLGYEEWIVRSDQLSNAFRHYKMTVLSIATNDLEYATTAFQRINSKGTSLGEFDMVATLIGRDVFDLNAEMLKVREKLIEVGWGTLEDKFILSACRATLGLEFYKANVKATSQKLRDKPEILDEVTANLIRAARFLAQHCGIQSPEMLPYGYQSVLLSEALRVNPRPTKKVSQQLKNWLWRTAYTEELSSINEANLPRVLKQILKLAHGHAYTIGKAKMAPFPKNLNFNFSTARAKLLILRLAELKPQYSSGKPLEVGKLLALFGSRAILRLLPDYASVPENCFIVEPTDISKFRKTLLKPTKPWNEALFVSHAISNEAAQALKGGDYKKFLSLRQQKLIEIEKSFVKALGLDYESG